MRVSVVGGGPAGLAVAGWLRVRRPDAVVTVWEREPAGGSGFGLVLPQSAVDRLVAGDPAVGSILATAGVGWDRIEVRYRGEVISSAGHPYRALGRDELLGVLRARCRHVGVRLRPEPAPDLDQLLGEADVLVGADGARSATRRRWATALGARERAGSCRFLWGWVPCGAATFVFDVLEAAEGVVVLHRYPYGPDRTAVVVEMPEPVWRRFGADRSPVPVPPRLRTLLGPALGGVPLRTAGPGWRPFRSVSARRWAAGPVVLLGDAAHAAHFSVGSGIKLALDDAWALAGCLATHPPAVALARFEQRRRLAVAGLVAAAEASQRWFETVADQLCPDPLEFAQRLLTRSGRLGRAELDLARRPDRAALPPVGLGGGR